MIEEAVDIAATLSEAVGDWIGCVDGIAFDWLVGSEGDDRGEQPQPVLRPLYREGPLSI